MHIIPISEVFVVQSLVVSCFRLVYIDQSTELEILVEKTFSDDEEVFWNSKFFRRFHC